VHATRETFGSRFGALMTMIGVAAGLGNIWRFPYMVGEFGGAAFVVFYVVAVAMIGAPALMAELALGRYTRRGPVGAFEEAGLPLGRPIGWFFFFVMTMALAYYSAVLGWVLLYATRQFAGVLGAPFDASIVLPPVSGFALRTWLLQATLTAVVILSCAWMLLRGVRRGVETASRLIIPCLFVGLIVMAVRSLTLPGAAEGLAWYILKFDLSRLSSSVIVAALGQAIFSLSLGGTFMVVYGSYLDSDVSLPENAFGTAFGDTAVGLIAGLVIFPAVFSLGLEPGAGPALLFDTLPRMFEAMPGGAWFGLLFFAGLFGAAYLSDVAGFEVVVAGLTDNTRLDRRRAVWLMAGVVFVCSLPPTLNMGVFVPWDLTFGSGMQTLGALLSVLAIGWCVYRADALRELASREEVPGWVRPLYLWLRYLVPFAIVAVGVWWLLTDVLGMTGGT